MIRQVLVYGVDMKIKQSERRFRDEVDVDSVKLPK